MLNVIKLRREASETLKDIKWLRKRIEEVIIPLGDDEITKRYIEAILEAERDYFKLQKLIHENLR